MREDSYGQEQHDDWAEGRRYFASANGRQSPIPRHGNLDLATGTLHRIRRNLGIPRADFDQAYPIGKGRNRLFTSAL